MSRSWIWLIAAAFAVVSCGPNQGDCSGSHPDFTVTLELGSGRPLSDDTVVHVTYGGTGMEDYSPLEQGVLHEVVFCKPFLDEAGVDRIDASAAAGASGSEDASIDHIVCDLWTGGAAQLQVQTAGLEPVTYDLRPHNNSCSVNRTLVLDSPDAG